MKSIIPFSKELSFDGKLSEITSISLEREFEVKETSIEGNLFVTGDYKSHEISANVIPFSFKIPFSIEIPESLKRESITLEINDFAYDILENNQIKVNIELELNGEEELEEQAMTGEEFLSQMQKEEMEEEQEEVREEKEEKEKNEEREEPETPIEPEEEEKTREDNVTDEDHVILESTTDDNEYATYHIHNVKDGDTVETICTMYHSNVSMLGDYNDLSHLETGEKVIIPFTDES